MLLRETIQKAFKASKRSPHKQKVVNSIIQFQTDPERYYNWWTLISSIGTVHKSSITLPHGDPFNCFLRLFIQLTHKLMTFSSMRSRRPASGKRSGAIFYFRGNILWRTARVTSKLKTTTFTTTFNEEPKIL